MSNILKGNYKTKNKVKDEKKADNTNDLEAQFEKEALKHLGGSIAFVSKKKVLWETKEKSEDKKNDKQKK
jgi:hypothetical protein